MRARRADGYHEIETVFAFCEHGDALAVAEGVELALDIVGDFAAGPAPGEDNLVLRAGRALRERCRVAAGARLTLDKRLPVAAGLGGGSADAAAALRLLTRWWELAAEDADLLDIAASLGADVPACLLSRPMRGDGRGDVLTSFDDAGLAGTPVLLVNPRVPLSTAAVFAAWDGVDRGPLGDWRDGRNDLAPAAIALVPEIGEALAALAGAETARMSGSGATCFGLYRTKAARDADAVAIAAAHPHWWQLKTRLR